MAEPALELAPEAEVTVEALPNVLAIAVLAFCLGFILAVDAVVRGLFGSVSGAVGWIPFAGKVITSPVHKIEQKVVSFIGGLAGDVEASLGHNIHVAARLFHKLIGEFERLAVEIMILGALAAVGASHLVVQKLIRPLEHLIRKVEHELAHVTRTVVHSVTVVHKTIDHNIFPRVKIITEALPKFIHRDLLAIRSEARSAERVAHVALRKAEEFKLPKHAKTWAEAVALALPALGLEWLRCKDNPFNRNPKACSLWGDLSNLLGLLGDLVLFSSLCELIPQMESLFSLVAEPFIGAMNEAAEVVCHASAHAAPPLPEKQLDLPANPGIVLNLP